MKSIARTLLILVSIALCGTARGAEQPAPSVADADVFRAFLESINDGLGPQPLPEPPKGGIGIAAQIDLGIAHELQRKDTNMLCLEACRETGAYAWDSPHANHAAGEHGDRYCVRASIRMINAYYGGNLTQDRITYYTVIEWPDSNKQDIGPEFELWHDHGSGHEALPWALGFAYDDKSKFIEVGSRPTYAQIKSWIDAARPIRVSVPGHSMVIDGYWQDGAVDRVHLLDPWFTNWSGNEADPGPGWRDYDGAYLLGVTGVTVCPTPADVTTPRSDEWTVAADSDGDGVCDFDELKRFDTNRLSADTDSDGVPDKAEIRSYIFDAAGNHNLLERIGNIWVCRVLATAGPCGWVYNQDVEPIPWASQPDTYTCPRCGNRKRFNGVDGFEQNIIPLMPAHPWDMNWDVHALIVANADPDGDGLRCERDPDSDNDGALDGEEDTNHNGIYEPGLGETDPYNPDSYPFAGVIRANQDLMAVRYAVAGGDLVIRGNLYCSGSKAVVDTKTYGIRMVYVEESAESYHFDRGQTQLRDGSVTIHLDPVFRQTVCIDDAHPALIRLTATADCNGLYVSQQAPASFTVRELDGGTSNASFNWEVAAKRRGYADERLEPFEAGE